MASFLYYDLGFLIIFSIAVALFLYKNRKKLDIEAKIILLYRTKMGLDTISYIAKRHPKLLKFLSIFVIIAGYFLMGASIILLVMVLYLMFLMPIAPKIPPIIPLLPYIDKVFPGVGLPPFYFTYWIIVIGIVAVVHEFSHGIFAKLRGIKLKATGFGFIGPLLAAFVELDEKQMSKKPIKDQLAVLGAGSASNLILWVLFLGITAAFFSLTFVPMGVQFNTYMVDQVNLSDITLVEGLPLSRNIESFDEFAAVIEKVNKSDIELKVGNESYFVEFDTVMLQKRIIENSDTEIKSVILFSDTPAYRANLSGAIQKISFENETYEIKSIESLQGTLSSFKAGDEIRIETTKGNYTITLDEHPEDKEKAFLGIGFNKVQQRLLGKVVSIFSFKDPFIYYAPIGNSTNGSIVVFIFNLLYWITLVNIAVALFNMMPVGIVDGGRFFFLTALALTKSEKKAFKWFKLSTWFITIIFLMLLGVWFVKAF